MTATIQEFKFAYIRNLQRAVREFPDEYGWPLASADAVANKMFSAIENGTFNHDGRAFKWTCQELGIKYGRKSIYDFWHFAHAKV